MQDLFCVAPELVFYGAINPHQIVFGLI